MVMHTSRNYKVVVPLYNPPTILNGEQNESKLKSESFTTLKAFESTAHSYISVGLS